jgi:nicotinamide mononucleotide transporter
MNALLQLLDVNNTFFTIFNYPMSYVEFFGTLLNVACVYLLTRKNIWNWPIGIAGVIMFGALFYQLNLYADLLEQGFYLVTGFWGWYIWATVKKPNDDAEDIVVKRNTQRDNTYWAVGIAVCTLIGTWVMTRVHLWLPALFPEPAALPLLDVFTTVMSFAAQILLIKRVLENWALWIVVDIIAIGLYWYKGVALVAVLYAAFLVLATRGYITWRQTYRRQQDEDVN